MNNHLTGKWTGIIIYGADYENQKDEKLFFVADLTIEDGNIFGSSKDLNQKVDTGIAIITGFIDNDLVSFIKRYEFEFYFDEKGNTIIDKTKPGPPITYTGVYNSQTNSIEGHWEVIDDRNVNSEIEAIGEGTFQMKKE